MERRGNCMSLRNDHSRLYSLKLTVYARSFTSLRTSDLRFHSVTSFRTSVYGLIVLRHCRPLNKDRRFKSFRTNHLRFQSLL